MSAPHGRLSTLTLAAIGVVYGDIGTSPLYTMRECLHGHHLGAEPGDVLGVLSMIVWSLIMVVTVKYMVFVMRADNHGEGGILALLALVPARLRTASPGRISLLAAIGIFGAALLYGDGMITPAISVLSAMEGLEVATPAAKPFVLPLACIVLLGLFSIQSRGTAGLGKLFAPVMVLWFTTLAVLGAWHVAHHPSVLAALSPHHAVAFFADHGQKGLLILGSVVLAITGAESVYADLGHFGVRPIRLAWLGLVLPSLLLAYFGQGALVLSNPATLENPFFAMVPAGPAVYALVALATAATVIASQALISGVFSLTHAAVQLGYFPRVTIRHTSRDARGQIYVPEINWFLAIACLTLVLAFQASTRMASAYGIAVCGTMIISSMVFFVVARRTWKWPMWKALPLLLLFLCFDIPFLGANLLKFKDGGYVPVFIAAALFLMMMVWNLGRGVLTQYQHDHSPPWPAFFAEIKAEHLHRTAGLGVFMASTSAGVPMMLAHHARRLSVLPARAIVLTVRVEDMPHVAADKRIDDVTELGHGFYRVVALCGFMQEADVPAIVAEACTRIGATVAPDEVTYYLGRETFLATKAGKLGPATESVFHFLSRNARTATSYFKLPPEQVVELGVQIDL